MSKKSWPNHILYMAAKSLKKTFMLYAFINLLLLLLIVSYVCKMGHFFLNIQYYIYRYNKMYIISLLHIYLFLVGAATLIMNFPGNIQNNNKL